VKLGFIAGSKLTLVLAQDITMPTELFFARCPDFVSFCDFFFIILKFSFWKLFMTTLYDVYDINDDPLLSWNTNDNLTCAILVWDQGP
jgi:hypothetical protein